MRESTLENIHEDYMNDLTYSELAKKYHKNKDQIHYIVTKNKWTRPKNRGHKNAKGNKGGPGAEKGNKRALVTGAYETIDYNTMTDFEKKWFDNIQIQDPVNLLIEEYKILSVREFRVLKQIKEIENNKEEMMLEKIREKEYKNKSFNETTTESINTLIPLLRLEEALTKIQEAKRKCLESLHRIETDNRRIELELIKLEIETAKEDNTENTNISDDSFIKALESSTEEVWKDYK